MYEHLSRFYDDFMADVPYDEWARYLIDIVGARTCGCDVGCGSGKLLIPFIQAGYDMTGCDVSGEMLTVCRANLDEQALTAPLLLTGGEQLRGNYDFVLASCDVVNYMKSPDRFFEKTYAALNTGGVLVFDISTAYKLREIIGDNVFTESNERVTYIWENCLNRRSVDMFLTFFVKTENGLYEKACDEQTQYIHDYAALVTRLKEIGYKKVRVYGFLSRRAPKDDEQRVHIVAYK